MEIGFMVISPIDTRRSYVMVVDADPSVLPFIGWVTLPLGEGIIELSVVKRIGRLNYCMNGEGPTLVFMAQIEGLSELYLDQKKALEKRFSDDEQWLD